RWIDHTRQRAHARTLLFELALAFDLMREADAADGHRGGRGELLVALEFSLRQSPANGLLNFALGANPQCLEKFANAGVENVLVHDRLLCAIIGLTSR